MIKLTEILKEYTLNTTLNPNVWVNGKIKPKLLKRSFKKMNHFISGLNVKVHLVKKVDGLTVTPVEKVNVNLVVEKRVKNELNTLHVVLHPLNVKLRVKVKNGEKQND